MPSSQRRRPGKPVAYSAEAFSLAKSRESLFLTIILPPIHRRVTKRLRNWPDQLREELLQEASARAWLFFVSFCHHHPDCTPGVGLACMWAKWIIVALLRFRFICGADRGLDAMSRRTAL